MMLQEDAVISNLKSSYQEFLWSCLITPKEQQGPKEYLSSFTNKTVEFIQ